jgi:hypothetical protein
MAAAAAALAAGTAHAAGDTPSFNQMDSNNDGALTRSEAQRHAKLIDQFAQVDDNGDGRLTRGEYLQIMARQDLHTLRDSLAEFIDPQGKPPLAKGPQLAEGQQVMNETPPAAASARLVRNVQGALQAQGVDPGPIDGIWGPRTHQAVLEFQEANSLEATGQLNAPTLAALGIADGESASAGQSRPTEQPTFESADRNHDG